MPWVGLQCVIVIFPDHTLLLFYGYLVLAHIIWASSRENLSSGEGGGCDNTCADQPAHSRSLISDFVIRLLESIISRLATSKITNFWLVSVAEGTGFSLALSETPKTGFPVSLNEILGRS